MDENVSPNSADGCQCEMSGSSSSVGPQQCNNAVTSPTRSSTTTTTISVNVHPTTGGQFPMRVSSSDNAEQLKKLISKKLKVAKERICLLHKEKELREGSLSENGVQDGSNITLLPMVETGLFTQKPEQSVLQALESLSDVQVNDFLSGKSPLNLAMRLGDHMMFIQLQLSTVGTALTRTKGPSTQSPSTSNVHNANRTSSAALAVSPKPASISSPSTSRQPVPLHRIAHPTPMLTAPPRHDGTDNRASTSTKGEVLAPPSSSCSHRGTDSAGPSSRPCISQTQESSSSCPGHRQQRHLTDVTHLLDTRTLAEASRNLSQTLRHLSSQALSNSRTEKEETAKGYRSQGAIIESMHHHGRGVFSGTFSGTLNPALQDRHGHPKRDISTIVHILNDLLEATPQYRRQRGSEASAVRAPSPPKAVGNRAIENATKEYSRLSLENEATRGKMEQLQMMLEERRARRRARRVTPYPSSWPIQSNGTASNTSTEAAVPLVLGQPQGIPQEAVNAELSNNKMAIEAADKLKNSGSLSASSAGTSETETPMDCDAPEGTLANNGLGDNATANEYLNLNPETVVA